MHLITLLAASTYLAGVYHSLDLLLKWTRFAIVYHDSCSSALAFWRLSVLLCSMTAFFSTRSHSGIFSWICGSIPLLAMPFLYPLDECFLNGLLNSTPADTLALPDCPEKPMPDLQVHWNGESCWYHGTGNGNDTIYALSCQKSDNPLSHSGHARQYSRPAGASSDPHHQYDPVH